MTAAGLSDEALSTPRVLPYICAGMIALCVLVAGFGLWATQTTLAGAIITPGEVQADINRQIVQHPTGGVVSEVLVREGDAVVAGDILLRLDTSAAQTALAAARDHFLDLAAQRDRLRAIYSDSDQLVFGSDLLRQSKTDPALAALLDGQTALFDATRATLREQMHQLQRQIAQIKAQIAGIDGQHAAFSVQLKLTETALDNQKSLLSRGLVPAATVLEFERETSRIEGEIAHLAGQRAQADERLAGIEVERLQLLAEHREKALSLASALEQPMRQYRTEMQTLEAEIAQAEVRAPASGIVYGLQVETEQAVLRPAEPLLYLVPQDRPRLVVAHVPPRHIDQVKTGQSVKLRLSALDQRMTPEIVGKVSNISADVMIERDDGCRVLSGQDRASGW